MRLRALIVRLLADFPARHLSFTMVYTVRATATWQAAIRCSSFAPRNDHTVALYGSTAEEDRGRERESKGTQLEGTSSIEHYCINKFSL